MTNDDLFYYTGTAGYVDGDKLYTVDSETTYLLEYDLRDMSYRVLSYDALWDEDRIRMILDIFKVDDRLIFTMLFSRNVLIYDMKTGVSNEYGGQLPHFNGPQNVRSFIYNNRVYIVPEKIGDGIEVFDLKTCQYLECISLPVDRDAREADFRHIAVVDDTIWFCLHDTPYIYAYDLDTHKYERFDVGDGCRLDGLFRVGDRFYVTLQGESAFSEWDKDNGLGIRHEITTMPLPEYGAWLSDMILTDAGVVGLSRYSDHGFIYDPVTDTERNIVFPGGTERVRNSRSTLFKCVLFCGESILIIPNTVSSMMKIDIHTGEITETDTHMHIEDIRKYCARRLTGIPETGQYDLEYYLRDELREYQEG